MLESFLVLMIFQKESDYFLTIKISGLLRQSDCK